MHPRDFSYWLMGYFELTGATTLTAAQAKEVAAHLALTMSTRPDASRPNMSCGRMFLSATRRRVRCDRHRERPDRSSSHQNQDESERRIPR